MTTEDGATVPGDDATNRPAGGVEFELDGDEAPAGAETSPARLEQLGRAATAVLDRILNVGVAGAGPWKGSAQVAEEYLTRRTDPEDALRRVIATHVRIVASTGFVTGLGGLITLPVSIPADLSSLWLVQGRMTGAIAYLRGYDLASEEVRSLVLVSLIGAAGTEVLAKAGIEIGTKSALSAIRQVPGRVLIEINKKVGFRLVTRAGTKGVINLTKLAPVVGGVVGGSVNAVATRTVATYAKKNFPPLTEG